jgi:exopolysaccharide biosynthesis WecB/TagA/CpsF family protein
MERFSSIPSELETTLVGGLATVCAGRDELAEWIVQYCKAVKDTSKDRLPALVFSSNGQGIALHGQDAEYDAAMAAADVIHADGMSVVFASRFLTNAPIRERSATTDLFHNVARVAERDGLNFFILGSTESQNKLAVAEMKRLYPKLHIVGRRNGFFSEDEDEAVCAEIVAAGTDVLWVGLGKPKQEIWSARNRNRLRGVGCIKTCGGLYAFLSGDSPRAPEWMQNLGLEWVYRTSQDPKRLLWRYVVTNPKSVWKMVTSSKSIGSK